MIYRWNVNCERYYVRLKNKLLWCLSYKAYITKHWILFSTPKVTCLRLCPATLSENHCAWTCWPHVLSLVFIAATFQVWCKFYNSVCQCSLNPSLKLWFFWKQREELARRGHTTSKAELVEWCLKIEWGVHILTIHTTYINWILVREAFL